jgi:hypothetical protein
VSCILDIQVEYIVFEETLSHLDWFSPFTPSSKSLLDSIDSPVCKEQFPRDSLLTNLGVSDLGWDNTSASH